MIRLAYTRQGWYRLYDFHAGIVRYVNGVKHWAILHRILKIRCGPYRSALAAIKGAI